MGTARIEETCYECIDLLAAKVEKTRTHIDLFELGGQKQARCSEQADLHLAHHRERQRAVEQLHAQHGRAGTHTVGESSVRNQLARFVVQALGHSGSLGPKHRVLENQASL